MSVYYATDTQSNTSGSPVPKHQGGLGLRLVERGGGAADDEGGASVASKTLLENTCQLAVTVRNVGFLCVCVWGGGGEEEEAEGGGEEIEQMEDRKKDRKMVEEEEKEE